MGRVRWWAKSIHLRKNHETQTGRKTRLDLCLSNLGRSIGPASLLRSPFVRVCMLCILPMDTIPVVVRTACLLILSNIFMTFAWYGHLKNLQQAKWYIAALASWSIALFEYLLQVPANRIGYTQLSVAQLKIMQEVITLSVFVPFSLFYMQQPLKLDYLWAGLCLVGAVYFIFRA